MLSFLRSRLTSIRFALEGWWYVLRTQRNTWVHALITTGVIILGVWLQLSPQDWAILLITIALVWAAEFFNTSLEALADLVHPDEHPQIKIIKDVSAAGVLITATAAILVGLLILGPPLVDLLIR
ncbi:MAG: diacylglycerol kinase family protein [Chloroflexi bacterium]|jgi:diacylglycerol kinase|nr:diacylglycerol kinase family protein [Chloroflexota bacterium]